MIYVYYLAWFMVALCLMITVALLVGLGWYWLSESIPCWYHRIMFNIEAWRLRKELEKHEDGVWDTGEDWDTEETTE